MAREREAATATVEILTVAAVFFVSDGARARAGVGSGARGCGSSGRARATLDHQGRTTGVSLLPSASTCATRPVTPAQAIQPCAAPTSCTTPPTVCILVVSKFILKNSNLVMMLLHSNSLYWLLHTRGRTNTMTHHHFFCLDEIITP